MALSPLGRVSVAAKQRRDAEEALRAAVEAARDDGATWEELAAALGVSRQTAHRKYSGDR